VTSVVGLCTFANSSNGPTVVFVDMQQEYVAAPRVPAISRIDSVLDERSCLSTLIDAFHRNHKVTYLRNASASHALEDVSADEIHRAVSKISGLYGDVHETDDWIASTLPRTLGIGKNAGG
jgi:hypothetical protein